MEVERDTRLGRAAGDVAGDHGVPCVDVGAGNRMEDGGGVVEIGRGITEAEFDNAAGGEGVGDEAGSDGVGVESFEIKMVVVLGLVEESKDRMVGDELGGGDGAPVDGDGGGEA